MAAPTNGELKERVAELEGLLASTTRRLEACQRELVDANDALDAQPIVTLGTVETAPHVAAVEVAIARLAGLLRDDVTDHDDLWLSTEQSEPRLEVLADAIRTLATAHQAITPKPLPPIR